jgi:hypothetical protein
VLCAYLGQLARVRDALSSIVTVVIDDRDAQELADREEEVEETATVERVNVSKKVLFFLNLIIVEVLIENDFLN